MKRVSKKITTGILVVSLLCSLGADVKTANAAKTAKISQKKLTLEVGQKKKLKVKFAKKKVKWTSNKKKIATVSQKGIVKAKKEGKAVITAKVGKKKYKCKVTVVKNAASESVMPVTTASPNITTSIPEGSPTPNSSVTPEGSVSPAADAGSTTEPSKVPQETTKPTQDPNNTNKPNTDPVESTGPDVVTTPDVVKTPEPEPTINPMAGDLTMSKGSGTYNEEFTLTLDSATDSTIYYTTDGSDPRTSESRKVYNAGIQVKDRSNDANVLAAYSPDLFDTLSYYISGNNVYSYHVAPSGDAVDKCTVIRSTSCNSEGIYSDVITNTYFIGAMSEHVDNIASSVNSFGKNLSIISITMNEEDLFDYDTGIYVKGKYFDESLDSYIEEHGSISGISVEHDLTANFKQRGREWEKECHIEYFESDGNTTTCEIQQDCGIRIQGNYSRENVQKSFRLYAREEYGKKNFKYAFWDDLNNAEGETMAKFKTIVLRNGGNDAFNYKYKDIFMQSFVHDRAYNTLHGRPCVVYLNGEYWGYYVLQDDVTDNYMQEKYGVEKDDVVVYKASDEDKYADYKYKLDEGEVPDGETLDYYLRDTLNYLDGSNDFSDDAVYQEFCNTYVDEASMVDYFATMIYLGNGWDWPDKNWVIWKTKAVDANNIYGDGKWRFHLSDLDLTTVPTWSSGESGEWQNNPVTVLMDKTSSNILKKFFSHLMDNATFRSKLKTAINEIGSVNYNYDVVSEKAEKYKGGYGALANQFLARFNSGGGSIGEANHNANLSFLSKRMNYVPTLQSYIDNAFPNKTEAVDGTLVWEGSWTRYGSSNYTTSETEGLTTARDDDNYIQITISDWSAFTNPVLKVSVADGYSESTKFHIWNEGKTIIDKYYVQNEEGWIGQEIPLSALSGNPFYINANDCTITRFEIYDKE